MNHFSFELSLLAVIPALILCGYVFYKDRIEKEPIGLLALLFGIGAVAYVPVYFAQDLIVGWIDSLFASKVEFSAEGMMSYASAGAEFAHNILCALVGFSLIQICLKWVLLFFVTRKNKHFNYLFDGIVYSVFLSLGFAVAENIFFVVQNDVDLILPKLLTSVPCHLFVGVLMGYYYTMWHTRFVANGIEEDMLNAGVVEKDNIRSSAIWLVSSFVVPLLLNALYIFAGTIKNDTVTIIFYLAVFALYAMSFVLIDMIAARDANSKRYLCRLIAKGHPDLSKDTIENIVNNGVVVLADRGDEE